MNVLVVYYSWSGKAATVAHAIQEKLKNAEVRVIQETKKRKGFGGFIRAAAGSLTGHKTDIKPMDHNLSAYDLIVIGSPVWMGKPSTAFNAFVADTDFKGKNIILFATSASKFYKGALKQMEERIVSKGGAVKESIGLSIAGKSDNELFTETTLRIEPVIRTYL